jgi:N utilization substance protein A
MNKEFKKAFDAIIEEKKLNAEILIDAMQAALSSSYKKNFNEQADIRTEINTETGEIKVYKVTTVVDEIDECSEEGGTQITLKDAKKINKSYNVGDEIIEEVTPKDFGRVAIGVAKQVVLQKIREAERNIIMEDFEDKENELMVGFLAMEDKRNYYVDLGKARGILPRTETIPGEELKMGSSVKVYITKIESSPKGPYILLSRKHYGFVKRLFEHEIPEFSDGILVMHGVAREAGIRSKVAVSSTNSSVDPIGSCIGEKGRRIANIIRELGGEKIDIVKYSDDIEEFIANALSPAKNLNISITDDKNREALVIADDDNLSLAIGKKGINIKLASKLTRYKINIKSIQDINKEINERQ